MKTLIKAALAHSSPGASSLLLIKQHVASIQNVLNSVYK